VKQEAGQKNGDHTRASFRRKHAAKFKMEGKREAPRSRWRQLALALLGAGAPLW
jgi:hypothetical protein